MMERQTKHDELEASQINSEQPGLSDTDSSRKCEKHCDCYWQLLQKCGQFIS